jgi:Flp pilus assembly protein TadD
VGLAGMSAENRQKAEACFKAGEYRQSRETALAGLAQAPDDVELLLLAGRAGVELDAEDAVGQLRRATELAPSNAEAWTGLGEALAAEGATEEAGDAFRRAVEINPEDRTALSHLGHTAAAAGRGEEAVDLLSQAAESMRGTSTAAINLVDMYRTLGRPEEALQQALRVAEAEPDDLLAALDVAELSLEVGKFDEALAAFRRVRELDDALGPEASGEAPAALPERQAPTQEEGAAALKASLQEYRRLHAEDRRLGSEDLLG